MGVHESKRKTPENHLKKVRDHLKDPPRKKRKKRGLGGGGLDGVGPGRAGRMKDKRIEDRKKLRGRGSAERLADFRPGGDGAKAEQTATVNAVYMEREPHQQERE